MTGINNTLLNKDWVFSGTNKISRSDDSCNFPELSWVFAPSSGNYGDAFVNLYKGDADCHNIVSYQTNSRNTYLNIKASLPQYGLVLKETKLVSNDSSQGIKEIYASKKLVLESIVSSSKTTSGNLKNYYYYIIYFKL